MECPPAQSATGYAWSEDDSAWICAPGWTGTEPCHALSCDHHTIMDGDVCCVMLCDVPFKSKDSSLDLWRLR